MHSGGHKCGSHLWIQTQNIQGQRMGYKMANKNKALNPHAQGLDTEKQSIKGNQLIKQMNAHATDVGEKSMPGKAECVIKNLSTRHQK